MSSGRTVGILVVVLVSALAAGSCGGGEDAPEQQRPPDDVASLIPTAPAPQPGATPTPVPDDGIIYVDPGGGDGGAVSGTCGEPFPPPVSRFNVKVHSHQADRYVLDSTPLVGPDAVYCASIGFPDRSFCPLRPEGNPERQACEAARVGIAQDTGRAGPTWSVNGAPCDGGDHDGGSCANHGSNQYLAIAYGTGTFKACAASGVCGRITLP